jgi:predicted transcriptional regulator
MVKLVEDVFSKGFTQVQENDTVSSVQSLFKEGLPPVLAVFDSKGSYKGVISQKSIKRSSFVESGTKVKSLTQSAPAVTLQGTLSKLLN